MDRTQWRRRIRPAVSMVWALALMVVGAHAGAAGAAEPVLTLGGGMRLRYELQDNFNATYYGDRPGRGSASDGFLLGRFRLGLDWYPSPYVHVALWGQHADAWDLNLPDGAFYKATFSQENHPCKDRWELYTSYLELRHLMGRDLRLIAGRQLIHYGNNRVFGPGQWGNTGRWIWDAVRLSWRFERGFVDCYYGRTMLHDVDRFSLRHRHGFESLGLYAHYELLRRPVSLAIEPMVFTKSDRHDTWTGERTVSVVQPDGTTVTSKKKGDLSSWYGGARVCGRIAGGFDYDATLLFERGRWVRDAIRAYGYHLCLGYRMPGAWQPRVSLEYSVASGDSDPGDGTHETFQGGFGARDKMYGRMNLFHWRNLRDLQANLQPQPRPWLRVTCAVHDFRLDERRDGWYLNAKAYRDPAGASGNEVGREFDVVVTCRLPRQHILMAGYGHFWPGEFARAQASDKQADWVFVQWEYTFNLPLLQR